MKSKDCLGMWDFTSIIDKQTSIDLYVNYMSTMQTNSSRQMKYIMLNYIWGLCTKKNFQWNNIFKDVSSMLYLENAYILHFVSVSVFSW